MKKLALILAACLAGCSPRFDAKDPVASELRMIEGMSTAQKARFGRSLAIITVAGRVDKVLMESDGAGQTIELDAEAAKKIDGLTADQINSLAQSLVFKVQEALEQARELLEEKKKQADDTRIRQRKIEALLGK